jgi:transcriptional regulator with XRE-family HTH domain
MDGEFLKGKREELGLSVEQMAACLGVDPATLAALEDGAPISRPIEILAQLVGSAIIPDAEGKGFVNVAAVLLSRLGISAPLSPQALQQRLPPFSAEPHHPSPWDRIAGSRSRQASR